MLSQEIIYQHLQNQKFSDVIRLLYENGNFLDTDPSMAYAINVFMTQFFEYISSAEKHSLTELNHDLDILFISHTQNKYRLNDDQAIKLIHLLYPRVSKHNLYKGAKDYPQDPICKEIIAGHQQKLDEAKNTQATHYNPQIANHNAQVVSGQKFETEIRHKDNKSWVKVFLRSEELIDTIANHIGKLSSVGTVNITKMQNGRSNLTIYGQRPYTIEEAQEEIILTLENYFSRSPSDPIFKETIISGISDTAYFQVLDYILKLGVGLEGYRSLSVKMDEERYRDYFVNYLDSLSNNHTATGETFHGVGKTDILIRNQAKEVLLIAECKLWNGKEYLKKAIDQLFQRYIVWRDGKAALLVFNTKATGFTKIIEASINTLKAHPLCVSFHGRREKTSYSFTFRNHQDQDKLIKLELVLFNFA